MALKSILLQSEEILPGKPIRLLPKMEVEEFHRLHLHVSNIKNDIRNLSVRVVFGTPVPSKVLTCDHSVWFERNADGEQLQFTATEERGKTGMVLSVPVIAPLLYDIVLENLGDDILDQVFVTLMAHPFKSPEQHS